MRVTTDRVNEIVNEVCELCEGVLGVEYNEVKKIVVDFITMFGDNCEKFGILQEIEKDPSRLSNYVEEYNEATENEFNEILDKISKYYDSKREAIEEANRIFERNGGQYYTEDTMTFAVWLTGHTEGFKPGEDYITPEGALVDYEECKAKDLVLELWEELVVLSDSELDELKEDLLAEVEKREKFLELWEELAEKFSSLELNELKEDLLAKVEETEIDLER